MCTCRKRVNKELAERNARLASGFTLAKDGSVLSAPPLILLEKIDEKNRKRLPYLMASFCPFCGEKYPD